MKEIYGGKLRKTSSKKEAQTRSKFRCASKRQTATGVTFERQLGLRSLLCRAVGCLTTHRASEKSRKAQIGRLRRRRKEKGLGRLVPESGSL
jgi:hypothetical protein